MNVTLTNGEWIHPSLITPKTHNFQVSLNSLSQKFVQKHGKKAGLRDFNSNPEDDRQLDTYESDDDLTSDLKTELSDQSVGADSGVS